MRSLAIMENSLGPNHPDVATSLNNLGMLYKAQGKYADAEPLKVAPSIREKSLGIDHPDVAQSLENLAALYRRNSQNEDAESLERRAAPLIRQGEMIRSKPRLIKASGRDSSVFVRRRVGKAKRAHGQRYAWVRYALPTIHAGFTFSPKNNNRSLYLASTTFAR
ncbi:MAG: tetratricopeptide repeat protein [Betaproteobacteria bacterium]|nr:tetratricopeptide repeat protein [Betaproteobacteria bacterium]